MRFALTDEQRQFGAAVHDLLADADVPAAARAWASGDHAPGLAIWRELAKSGVTALTVPESCGGLAAHPVDLVVACEELGHHPLPGPIAESLAAAPQLLAAILSQQQLWPVDAAIATSTGHSCREPSAKAEEGAAEWLAGLASGTLMASVALPPHVPYALDGDVAGLVLLARPGASSREGTIWLGRAGTVHQSADRARRLFEALPEQELATGPPARAAVSRAIGYGALASAALLLGAGRGLLEQATQHAKAREQFGTPIGSFQAVKHALADVLIGLEFARPLLYAAAVALGANAPSTARDISAARVACADAAQRAARVALQVHGAMGYTLECDVSLWLAKVGALSSNWGSQAEHRAVVLAALTDHGSAGERTGTWS